MKDVENAASSMKRSINNNPMTLSADFNTNGMGLGNSGSGKNFSLKLPTMIAAQNESQNYKMNIISSVYIPKQTNVFDKTSEEII
jgi:hypothetical protein